MTTLRTIAEVRAATADARRDGRSIGFVPTMGALHEGHLHLIRTARRAHDLVVISVFVNPTQFDDPADLAAYPRVEDADAAAAQEAGADLLFAPSAAEMYPDGFATTIEVGGPSERLEGASRPGHFNGVATVVCKLLSIVGPDVAYFGQKDAQQLAVVRRMVTDLNLPCAIEAVPTVRDDDGLALSSRNARLAAGDRERALALSRALRAAEASVAGGRASAEEVLAAARAEFAARGVEPDYVELVDPITFTPLPTVDGDALLAVAARVGDVRLIDNQPLTRNGSH